MANNLESLAKLILSNSSKGKTQGSAQDQSEVHVAEVVRHGDKILIPESISLDAAQQVIARLQEHEEQEVNVSFKIDCFPWEGALALRDVLKEKFGVGLSEGIEREGFFGKVKLNARDINIEVDYNRNEPVPWGMFRIAAADDAGYIETDSTYDRSAGKVFFMLTGTIRRKYQRLFNEICEAVQARVRSHSIYRGKALRIKFRDEDGDPIPLPEPKFWDMRLRPMMPIFSKDIERMVQTNIFTPIVHREACEAAGVPFKRGVLLAGPYGTGKTMVANSVANLAISNGITFLYLEDVRELAEGIRFARQYEPCVIFAEDVDRAVQGDDRTASIDQILNTLDGVDSKLANVMVICTTNHLDNINQAMLRPGRFDVVLAVEPPDAEAAERLIRAYAGSMLSPDTDLSNVSQYVAGQIPAVLREVVERSKLEVITRTGQPAGKDSILGEDLLAAAKTMDQQRKLLEPKVPDRRSYYEKAAEVLGSAIREAKVISLHDAAAAASTNGIISNGELKYATQPLIP